MAFTIKLESNHHEGRKVRLGVWRSRRAAAPPRRRARSWNVGIVGMDGRLGRTRHSGDNGRKVRECAAQCPLAERSALTKTNLVNCLT